MSKFILILLFVCIAQLGFSQNESSSSFTDYQWKTYDIIKLRDLISQVDFRGSAEYKGFVFTRSGRFLNHITIRNQHQEKTIEVTESSFLLFINQLEKKLKTANPTMVSVKINNLLIKM